MDKGEPDCVIIPWLSQSEKLPQQSATYLNHLCSLDINGERSFNRLTQIICTVGPKSRDIQSLEHMMETGMSVARLNLSHGTFSEHEETLRNIRIAVENQSARYGTNVTCGIALDFKGPEIRTGEIVGYPTGFDLVADKMVTVTADWNCEKKTNENLIYVDFNEIEAILREGDQIIIDNGEIILIVKEICLLEQTVECIIKKGGYLGSEKLVIFPGVPLEFPIVTPFDVTSLKFAVQEEVDFILVSLIRNVDTLHEMRELLGEAGRCIGLIAKIESEQALDNLEEIIDVADGIIVSRRSLSLNYSPEKMFIAQKAIVARCNKVGKPVICAQQILESMVGDQTATRSEIIDVANTVTDGCDAILLSSETSIGTHPISAIRTVDSICQRAEAALWSNLIFSDLKLLHNYPTDAAHAIAMSVVETSKQCNASAIVVVTTSGRSARLVSRYRPRCPILAVTRFSHVARQLSICRNIIGVHYTKECHPDWLKDVDMRVHYATKYGRTKGFIHAGDCLILVSGWRQGAGFTNTLRIIYVPPQESEQLQAVTIR